MVGPGKLRDETDGKLRASLEGRPPWEGACVTPPCRKPVIICPVGAAVETRQFTLDFSKDHPEAAASQVQAVRLQDRR